MSTPRIIVIGDSHTRALSEALKQRGTAGAGCKVDVHWLLTEKDGKSRGDLALQLAQDKIAALSEDDLLVVSLLGTLHNILGLLLHEQPFWICAESEADAVPEGYTVIPRQTMRDSLDALIRKNRRISELLKPCVAKRFHLMTPPPKGQNEFIAARMERYRDRLVAEAGIAPAVVRLRLWQLEMTVLSTFCAERNMAMISPPLAALTPEGFLAPPFYGPDATHANAAYGKLVIDQLQALAQAR